LGISLKKLNRKCIYFLFNSLIKKKSPMFLMKEKYFQAEELEEVARNRFHCPAAKSPFQQNQLPWSVLCILSLEPSNAPRLTSAWECSTNTKQTVLEATQAVAEGPLMLLVAVIIT
jgi:hypothetical protein